MMTKITKKPIQNVKHETEVLELIHSDLCDLHANKKYFVTFIDDALRFCYVYLLHTKDEPLDKLKVFKTQVELQQGSLIKRFRTDRGGEYMDTLYFQPIDITHEMNASYTPQQNGISERKNMVLKEIVSFMLSYSGLTQGFWGEAMTVVRLPDPKLKILGERGIECIFVGYAEHSKAFRSFSVPKPSLRIPNKTKNIGGSVVPKEVTKEVVQQPELEFRISKRNKTPKNFGPEFQLYLIDGTSDEVFDQHSYCFNVEDDPKTFDEAMKSQDVAFWKKQLMMRWTLLWAITVGCWLIYLQMDVKIAFLNGELDEEVYMNQPTRKFNENGFSMKDMREADVILGIRIKHESNGIEIFQSHYIEKVLKKFNYSECTPVSTPMDTSEKLMPNNSQAVSQLEYSRVIGCLMYAITCTRPHIAFAVGKLSRYTSNHGTQHQQAIQRVLKYLKKTIDYRLTYTVYPSVLEGYIDASWIINTEDNLSTSGWVFLLAASKEVEWLKNLLFEIPLWSKLITPISVSCSSAATLTKAYSQIYNGKSRHLGVRHSMIRELITNEVVSIKFMRSQQNLADHLTNGLTRDLVIKSAEGV
ncbi:zinc finger, CCHC-type containing protein [Tanacetum coccineum]